MCLYDIFDLLDEFHCMLLEKTEQFSMFTQYFSIMFASYFITLSLFTTDMSKKFIANI